MKAFRRTSRAGAPLSSAAGALVLLPIGTDGGIGNPRVEEEEEAETDEPE